MLDMSYATNLRLGDMDFGQETGTKKLKRLYLSHCGLQELPESLGQLKDLVTLDVSSNALTHLPESLPPKLQGLYASDNNLIELPEQLQDLEHMEVLDVTNNHDLKKLPPLLGANGAPIHTVLASCCRLEDGLPDTLFHSDSKLRTLALRGSHLPRLPDNLGNAASLTGFLSLGRNNLTSLPPSIGHATGLIGLSLDHNKNLMVLPHELVRLTNLQTFDCKFCSSLQQCSGCLPKNLIRLVITGSPHFDALDAMSEPLKKLELLDASFTKTTVRERLPDSFVKMPKLRLIKLNGCGGGPRLTELPEDFDRLTKIKQLELQV